MYPFILCYVFWLWWQYWDVPPVRRNDVITKIDRIYYINIEERQDRAEFMEWWLSWQDTPYARIPAVRGATSGCVEHLSNPKHCRGVIGVRMSNLYIMDEMETEGITMVLEDDVRVNTSLVLEAVRAVPHDWDIIRLDCWGSIPWNFPYVTPNIFKTVPRYWHNDYCGGTHATIWRSDSIEKLRKLWSVQPYDDIDCILTTSKLNSYCVQNHLAVLYELGSDISGAKWTIDIGSQNVTL